MFLAPLAPSYARNLVVRDIRALPARCIRAGLTAQCPMSSSARQRLPADVQNFVSGYPNVKPSPSLNANVQFYKNELEMKPDNLKYEDFMRRNQKDFIELEANHGYIQWLFPIREHGVNPYAQPLQAHEIETMAEDPEIMSRMMRSWKMMLGFYGIETHDGFLSPAPDSVARLKHLRNNSHNLLRITRMLKHLSEFPALQGNVAPLILYFVTQHSKGTYDLSPGTTAGRSLDSYWSSIFRGDKERTEVREIVASRGEFGAGKWGEREFKAWYEARQGAPQSS